MTDSSDIAIVGMALRVPGADTPDRFWHNLKAGFESLRKYGDAELRARGVPASVLADPNYVKAGMPLDAFDEFDPEFFGYSQKEAAILDPQHRQFYEVAWEALERAGCDPRRFPGSVGVYAGCGAGTYYSQHLLRNAELVRSVGLFLLRHTGNDKDFLATRVSYAFDLKGPSISVQAACSTSLVATHLGVQALLSREVDLALAGGVTIELPHGVGYLYQEGEILSPDGHCRPFDRRSRGTVFGSGVAIVVLKRLDDALRDGDHVHAVIKGSAVNNDGAAKVGYLAPSVEGQAAAVSEAIAIAGIGSDTIGYVECHGTGTPIGDPIEIAALTQAFGDSPARPGHCLVGSVKSNIGHLDTAAGTAGLIKAVLALENEAVPPSLNHESDNPAIDFAATPFRVASQLTPWPRGATPRRAGVNSLGVGGTNAFVVLEEAPAPVRRTPAAASPQLLVLSARSRKALDDYASKLAAWLDANPEVELERVAVSLVRGRRVFEHRRTLVADTVADAVGLLVQGDARRVHTISETVASPSLVFMFPGGGAQYPAMARGLYAAEPVFRRSLDHGLEVLHRAHGVDLRDVLLRAPADSPALAEALSRPSVQLPLIFLLELALVDLWRSKGVVPGALIGHSLGENAAACVAGVFSLEDGLGLVLLRGRLMDQVPDGGMLSVPLAAEDLAAVMGPDLDLAAANAPALSVVSGPNPALDEFASRMSASGIECRRVRIPIAAHSRMLEGILQDFGKYLRGIPLHPPSLPIVSNLTGKILTDAEATSPDYWVRHLRNTVRFGAGVELLLEKPGRVFLEVGPGSTLGSFVRQARNSPAQQVLGSLRHPDDPIPDEACLKSVAGRLWAMGVPIAEDTLWRKDAERIPLPTYAFQHSRYWIEPTAPELFQDDEALLPERVPAFDDWFHACAWVQRGVQIPDRQSAVTWWVFHDRDPLLLQAVAELREAGNRVIEITAGDAFARLGPDSFTLAPEAGGGSYQDLVDALHEADALPQRILHGWLLTRRESYRPGKTFLHRNQEHGFYSLFYLARALLRRVESLQSHWIVLANGAVSVADESMACPDKATALGACLSVPRELPGVTCRFVDLDLPTQPPAADAASPGADPAVRASLQQEVHAPAASEVVAWRGRVRWRSYIAPHRGQPAAPRFRVRDRGTYLITGGFGGVAGVIGEWLAARHGARLVLLSRTPVPAREGWKDWLADHGADDAVARAIRRIEALEHLGAEVLALTADVAVAEEMEDAVAQAVARFGRIDGVFHTAGALRDGLIPLKSEREIEEVFAAKLYGTLVLEQVLQPVKPEFLMLFSSSSAFAAPLGQIDYVAANTFLNACAEARRGASAPAVLAVDWGIWRGIGMVSGVPEAVHAADAAEAGGKGREVPVAYPLFDRRLVSHDGTSQVHWIEGRLGTGRHWMVADHRLLGGQALLPATGYVDMIRAALAEAGDAPAAFAVSGLTLLQPLFVGDGEDTAFRLKLSGAPGRWRVDVHAESKGSESPAWIHVASARAGGTDEPLGQVDLPALEGRCRRSSRVALGESALRTAQEAHLRFGPRWQVLKDIHFGEGEAVAHLRIPDAYAGDLGTYPVHAGLLDIATGCAMPLIGGYGDGESPEFLWVPVSYTSYRQVAPMPPEFWSWIRVHPDSSMQAGHAAFDIALVDPSGSVFAELAGLTLKRLEGTLHRPQAANVQSPADEGRARSRSVGERVLVHNATRGITAAEGVAVIERALATAAPVLIATPLRPADLERQAAAVARLSRITSTATFSRPQLQAEFLAPRDDLERGLVSLWGRLLGVEGVGIRDSFFELGGHSLIAVRLFNEIADHWGVELPISALMQHPDVASLAEKIRGGPAGAAVPESGVPSRDEGFRYVVPMHTGTVGAGTPLFMVSGMFGNVLNLSHMAHLLGEDRPFFALQARGLFGEEPPHESFEEMAADYLTEIRRVQPHGPYLLGGFSGGGFVAFEMARQLLAAGEPVGALILLDTPIRANGDLGFVNKLELLWPGLRKEGPKHLLRKLAARRDWQRELQLREAARRTEEGSGAQFKSQRIGDAFVRALQRYRVARTDIAAWLFRPRLKPRFRLRDGRVLDADRNVLLPDNGWTPYVGSLKVMEVPGNHDSMVLEPNVRVLASALRRILDAVDPDGVSSEAVK